MSIICDEGRNIVEKIKRLELAAFRYGIAQAKISRAKEDGVDGFAFNSAVNRFNEAESDLDMARLAVYGELSTNPNKTVDKSEKK